MRSPVRWWCLWQLGILVTSGRPARATDRPLLVVVEAPPALDADAAEIRRAIGSELGAETVAPLKSSGDPPDRALIVALDGERIAVSLRTPDAAPIARSIPAPPERAARLRAIAWLAGNLARDQVSPILAEVPPEASALTSMPTLAHPADAIQGASAPSAPRPQTEPPSFDESPTLTADAELNAPASQHWSLGIADGPTTNSPICHAPGRASWSMFCPPLAQYGTAWRAELQRRPPGSGYFFGAAVEGGTAGGVLVRSWQSAEFAPQLFGATAFIGSAKRHGRWSLESSAGAGLELTDAQTTTTMSTSSSVTGNSSTVTTENGIRPGLSVEGALAAAHPIWDSLDVVFRLSAHLSTEDLTAWFLSGTIGLRYNL